MTDRELEQLLRSNEFRTAEESPRQADALSQKSCALLAPHVIHHAARLKKRRHDRIQTLLCALASLVFIGAFAFFFLLMRKTSDAMQLLRYALGAMLGGMVLVLLCAPALVWHEERQQS